MKSNRVQLIVLGAVLVALAGWVLRSRGQQSSPSNEAARMVRDASLEDNSPIEETSTVQRQRPSKDSTQSASRLGSADTTADAAPEEAADEDAQERKIKKGRPKRGGRRKTADNSDGDDDTPAAKPKDSKVQISGSRVKKGGP